jgi:diketogulonate reductase-like aldo/keto reductase
VELGAPRQTLLITSKVSPQHLSYDQVLTSCEKQPAPPGMEYLDLYLIPLPRMGMQLRRPSGPSTSWVRSGKVRAWGLATSA